MAISYHFRPPTGSAVVATCLSAQRFSWHFASCVVSLQIAPYLETLSKQADVVAAGVRFLKVDVDRLDKLAAKCSVSAMPTFHYYMAGKKVAEVVGARQDMIKKSLDAHMPASKTAVTAAAAKKAVTGAAKGPAAPSK